MGFQATNIYITGVSEGDAWWKNIWRNKEWKLHNCDENYKQIQRSSTKTKLKKQEESYTQERHK